MADISLVILSHNRITELSRNLETLLNGCQNGDEFQIIVVDNASTDGTKEFLLEWARKHPQTHVIFNKENKGVAGGRNTGYAVAERTFLVAIDDDTAIAAEDLRRIPALFHELPEVGILAFRVIHSITGDLQNPHGDHPCAVANHHGAGFATRRHLILELGGIDEECDYGAEELDYAIRVHASGWQVRYTPEITVRHNSMPRITKEEERRLTRRIYNNIRLFYKYFPEKNARLFACRHALPQLWNWGHSFGWGRIGYVLRVAREARAAGRRQHRPVPEATLKYYCNRHLRPSMGNVPLLERSLSALKNRWNSMTCGKGTC
jgi:GT2 family glycosyltransferase